jgi:tetratricopeptide (TPR) repeat protein
MSVTHGSNRIEYLLSGTDARGRRRYERIVAASVEEARSEMSRRGYENLELHTDDLQRSAGAGEPGGGADPSARISPKDEAALQRSGPFGFKLLLAKSLYKTLALPLLVFGALIGFALVPSKPMVAAFSIAALMLGPLLLALVIPLKTKILDAVEVRYNHADWEGVLALIPKVRQTIRGLPPDSIATLITGKEATSLLRLGRPDEAFMLVERLRESGASEPVVQLRLGSLHTMVGDLARAEECYRKAVELRPGDLLAVCLLADFLATHVNKPHDARQALASIDVSQLSDSTRWAIQSNQGVIALAEGRYEMAREELSRTIKRILSIKHTNAGWQGTHDYYLARLAVALARTGRREEAQRAFDQAEPFLSRHKIDALLKQCAAAGLRRSG